MINESLAAIGMCADMETTGAGRNGSAKGDCSSLDVAGAIVEAIVEIEGEELADDGDERVS